MVQHHQLRSCHPTTRSLIILLLLILASTSHIRAKQQAEIALHGTAISRVAPDTRKLTLHARTAEASAGGHGFVHFTHHSPAGLSRFHGAVTCLRIDAEGVVQLSGRVVRGETAAGVVLAGKDFAFTLDVGSDPQRFSLPRFKDATTLDPCSGGRPVIVPVSQGQIRLAHE